MGSRFYDSRIVVWDVIRYGGFAPILLLSCCASFAQYGGIIPGIYASPSPSTYPYYAYPARAAPLPPAPLPPAPLPPAPLPPAPLLPAGNPPAGNTPVVNTVQAPKPIAGLGFGAGVALSFGQSRVNNALAVGPNNIVRVTDSSPVSAGLVFESHYFFEQQPAQILGSAQPIQWGHGPFIALDASTDGSSISTAGSGTGSIYAGVSMGWMVGFRRITAPLPGQANIYTADNNSWNFGVGLHVNPKATVLGDGIVANMPLPTGETNPVRTRSEARYGVMLLTSYAF
jgi:hypothetical protein